MACLGEESRFRLVQALMGGARCVTDLAFEVGLSQSCTTRHLQALESRRVVRGTRDGKRVLYRIRDDDPALIPLLHWALDRSGGGPSARATRASTPGRSGRPAPAPRQARGARNRPGKPRAVRPAVAAEEEAGIGPTVPPTPAPSPPTGDEPQAQAPPGKAPRRITGSDIEDYLL